MPAACTLASLPQVQHWPARLLPACCAMRVHYACCCPRACACPMHLFEELAGATHSAALVLQYEFGAVLESAVRLGSKRLILCDPGAWALLRLRWPPLASAWRCKRAAFSSWHPVPHSRGCTVHERGAPCATQPRAHRASAGGHPVVGAPWCRPEAAKDEDVAQCAYQRPAARP